MLGSIDVDRDGRDDLVRALFCGVGNSQRLVVNTSSASGFNAAQDIPMPFGSLLQATIGDIDGDHDKDLIVAPYISSLPTEILVLKLNNGGTFDPTSVPVSEPYNPLKLIVSDINNDGRADVFVNNDQNMVLTQNADGTFTETAKMPGYFLNDLRARLADLTGDGLQDLVFSSGLSVQRPDGTFEAPVYYPVLGNTLVDLNGDGRIDTLNRLTFMTIRAPQ